jgi:pimeloyl-ACP methyl ester carboxylesterase
MTLYVNETGPVSAPTLVFLHGGGGGGWMWQPQLEAFADYHCVVPDLPEHGRSAEVKPFTIADSAVRVAELIRTRAHGGRAHVVGLSEGAQIALALLGLAPEVVDHAILSSALVRPIPGASLMSPGLISLSVKWSVEPFKNVDWWVRLNMKYSAGIPERYFAQFKEDFQAITGDQFAHIMIENQRFRLPEGLSKVTAPTLVVAGKKEYGLMRASVADIARAIPTAQGYLVAYPQSLALAEEHNWSLTAPVLFNQTVRAWLTGEPLPGFLEPVTQG